MSDLDIRYFQPSAHAFRDCPCPTRWLLLEHPGPGAYRGRRTGGDPEITEADVYRVTAADALRPGPVLATCMPEPEVLPHQWIAPAPDDRLRWHVHLEVLGRQVHIEDVRAAQGGRGGYLWVRWVFVDGVVAQVMHRLLVPLFGAGHGDDTRPVRCLLDDRHQLRVAPGSPMALAVEAVPLDGEVHPDDDPAPPRKVPTSSSTSSGPLGLRGRGATDHGFETVTWHDLEELLASLGATLGEVRRTLNGPIFDATFRGRAFEIRPWLSTAPCGVHVKDWELPAVQLLCLMGASRERAELPFALRSPLTLLEGSGAARVATRLAIHATPSKELRALLAAWLDAVRAIGEAPPSGA